MSEVQFFLFFVVLHVCGSSEGLENITAEPGENVTLPCKAPENNKVILLVWKRTDLQGKNVCFCRKDRCILDNQHESFRNRVFLKDSQMKDGNLSVDLKNVTMNDTGTYECKVGHENDPPGSLSLISSVDLSVDPPGEKGGQRGGDGEKKEEAGMSKGGIAGIVVGVLLLLLLAAVVVFWISKKRKNQHRDSPEPNEQQIPLRSQNRNPEASAD